MNTQTATVKMVFAPDKITVTVNGVAGKACTKATDILKNLGERTVDRHTADYDRDGDDMLTATDALSM